MSQNQLTEESQVKKPSIFVCKECKKNNVTIEKKQKSPKERPEIL